MNKPKKNKSLILTFLAAVSILVVAVPMWLYLGYWSLLICLVLFLNVLIYISYKNDVSIPVLGSVLQKEYSRVKLKIDKMQALEEKTHSVYTISFIFAFYKAYLKVLYYLILLFRGSAEGFKTVVDQSSPFGIKFSQAGLAFSLDGLPQEVRQAYLEEYFNIVKKRQKRVTIFSLAGGGVMIVATVLVSLTATLILPAAFQSEAATFGWNQKDWSGLATDQIVGITNKNWTGYQSKDLYIDVGVDLSLEAEPKTMIRNTSEDLDKILLSSVAPPQSDLLLEEGEETSFESAIIFFGPSLGFDQVSWPESDDFMVKIRTFNLPDASDANIWEGCDPIINGQDLSLNNCVTDQDLYWQYQIIVIRTNEGFLVQPQELAVNFRAYPNKQSLVSSPIDTKDDSTVISDLFWNAQLFENTDIKFQLRTSPDGRRWTEWLGPQGMDSYYRLTDQPIVIYYQHSDGVDDRYFQYRVILESAGNYSPILRDIAVVTDNDRAGAVITNVEAQVTAAGRAVVVWQTNKPTVAMIEYGLYEGGQSAIEIVKDFKIQHSVVLRDVRPGFEYYYKIIAEDEDGSMAESAEYFLTIPK